MKTVRTWMRVFATCTVLMMAGGVSAATTINYSDQWWVATESGWGVSIHQQANVLFVDLMVYGNDGRPTWFVSLSSLQATKASEHDVFIGDLYASTGPAIGGSFDPAKVFQRKVGTLTFDASGDNSALLSYTVDGTAVVKSVARETWGRANLEGEYDGYWLNNCPGNAAFDWEPTHIVVKADAQGRLAFGLSCPWCWTKFRHDLRGYYSQVGHLGRVVADLMAPDSGSITLSEIEMTDTGFTARLSGKVTSSGQTCEFADGRLGAIRAPQ